MSNPNTPRPLPHLPGRNTDASRPPTPSSPRSTPTSPTAAPHPPQPRIIRDLLKRLDDADLEEFIQQDPVLNTPAASAVLGLSPSRLEKWRQRGQGPAYVLYDSDIRYEFSELVAFKAAHRVRPNRRPTAGRRG